MHKLHFSLQTKLIIMVWAVVVIALFAAGMMSTRSVSLNAETEIGRLAMDIARIVARDTEVQAALAGELDQAVIQDVANHVCQSTADNKTNIEFVVVIDMAGIRQSHPNPEKIGGHIQGGDEVEALQGKEYISFAEGTLGKALRAFTPVYGADGRQIGAVVVGVLLNNLEMLIYNHRMVIYLATFIGMVVGLVGAVLLSSNIKKTLFGLEPEAIAKLLEERSAMLDSVREGVLAVDKEGKITLANAEALRVFRKAGLIDIPLGKFVGSYVPNTRLHKVLETGIAEVDQEQNLNGIIILTNRRPVVVNGQIVSAIATFRDMTEVRQQAEELTGVKSYVEALRSQAHEFMNQLHVILGMVELRCYDPLVQYIGRIAQDQQSEVGYVGQRIKNSVLAGLLISKFSRARECGAQLELAEESFIPEIANQELVNDVVCILGNLLDNAIDAVDCGTKKKITVFLQVRDGSMRISVKDSGSGIPPEMQERIFAKGFSTKGKQRGLGLAILKSSLQRLGGTISFTSNQSEGTVFQVQIPYQSKDDEP